MLAIRQLEQRRRTSFLFVVQIHSTPRKSDLNYIILVTTALTNECNYRREMMQQLWNRLD